MKTITAFTAVFLFAFTTVIAQDNSVNKTIDSLLIHEEYKKVIDTCRQILIYDSLNPVIYYKMGIAFQNVLEENNATECFFKAAVIDTVNPGYNCFKSFVSLIP